MATQDASFDHDKFEKLGFCEVSVEEGMTNAAQFTSGCSGSRSACCTRTCSADPSFVGSAEDWEAFLSVRGGEIQY